MPAIVAQAPVAYPSMRKDSCSRIVAKPLALPSIDADTAKCQATPRAKGENNGEANVRGNYPMTAEIGVHWQRDVNAESAYEGGGS